MSTCIEIVCITLALFASIALGDESCSFGCANSCSNGASAPRSCKCQDPWYTCNEERGDSITIAGITCYEGECVPSGAMIASITIAGLVVVVGGAAIVWYLCRSGYCSAGRK